MQRRIKSFIKTTSFRQHLVFFAVAVAVFLKCQIFDGILNSSVQRGEALWFFGCLLAKVSVSMIIASLVYVVRRRWVLVVLLVLIDMWIMSNVIYYRANNLIMTWQVMRHASNMRGFESSLLAYIDFKLICIPLLTLVTAPLLWLAKPNRRPVIALIVIILAMCVSIADSQLRIRRYEANGTEVKESRLAWMNPFVLPESARYFIGYNDFNNELYIHDHSIVTYFIVLVDDAVDSFRGESAVIIADDEMNDISQFTQPASEQNPVSGHLVVFLVESLEDWALDMRDIGGDYVCRNIRMFMDEHPVLFARNVVQQKMFGMSADGQLILNTGLLPVSEGVTSFEYGGDAYPNFAHFYQDGVVINPCHNAWNQSVVTYSYGYKRLIEPPTFIAWEDDVIVDKLLEQCKAATVPTCFQAITVSTHVPFDRVPYQLTLPDTIPETLSNYLQCLYYTDMQIGRFMQWADTASTMKDATIVITSDHHIFSNKGGWSDDVLEFAHRCGLPMETGASTCPFILAGPAVGEDILINGAMQMDYFPTILHAIGQRNYFWKGWGCDLLSDTPCDYAVDGRRAQYLSDKMIRADFFAK